MNQPFQESKELDQSVTKTKKPTFYDFIHQYRSEIVNWFLSMKTLDALSLHRSWVTRFNSAISNHREDIVAQNKDLTLNIGKMFELIFKIEENFYLLANIMAKN